MIENSITKKYSAAFEFASVNLVYTYCLIEDICLKEENLPDHFVECVGMFRECLGDYLEGGLPIETVHELRRHIKYHTDAIQTYEVCISHYDYAFSNIERRVKKIPQLVDMAGVKEELLDFIRNIDDAYRTVNLIGFVISQLPVRLTRKKFYFLVSERLSNYLGLPKSIFERKLDEILSESILEVPVPMKESHEGIYEFLKELQLIDWKHIPEDKFPEMEEKLFTYDKQLLDWLDFYRELQICVNHFHALLLTRDQAVTDIERTDKVNVILEMLFNNAKNKKPFNGSEDEEITKRMIELEESQETGFEKFRYAMSEQIEKTPANAEMEEIIRKVELLLSSSPFVSLDAEREDDGIVDAQWMESETKTLFDKLDVIFEQNPKQLVRSVMSSILSVVPPLTMDLVELEEYIENSLNGCSDFAEKEARVLCLRNAIKQMQGDAYGDDYEDSFG